MEKFTKAERIAGAQLAEWPGPAAEFPIEKLGATSIAMIRASLRERRSEAAARGATFKPTA